MRKGKATTVMGKKERGFAPLIHVSLEELVPHDHFYRHLEKSLDLSFVREFVQERYGVEVFRRFFEVIVEQCQQEKLVWGKELYIDGTQVNANADLDSLTPRFAVEARAAMQAHLAALFALEDALHEQQEASADRADMPQTDATAPVAT